MDRACLEWEGWCSNLFWLSVLHYTTRAGDRPESDPGEGRGGGYVDCIKIVKIVLTVPPFNIKIVN